MKKTVIKVEKTVNIPVATAWEFWTDPAHIVQWNRPAEAWHTPVAKNDLRQGGNFIFRIEAMDGSRGFDFAGVYDRIVRHEYIRYTLEDGRTVDTTFDMERCGTRIEQSFEAEDENLFMIQQEGWQSVLDSFKTYAENRCS